MIMINKVKEIWKSPTDNTVTGYIINGRMTVPNNKGNPIYDRIMNWASKDGNNIEPAYSIEEQTKYIQNRRISKLKRLMKNKYIELQSLSINLDWITDKETIQVQKSMYEDLYHSAKVILKLNPNDERADKIITDYENALLFTYKANLIIQESRKIIYNKIEANSSDVDELIEFVNKIKLTKDNLTDEKINNFMSKLQG